MLIKNSNEKATAPMPKNDEEIRNNSMKLFAYLTTISGLTDYPSNTRMFRQKDLMLTKIKEATGITDKTVKLYMYYLEQNNLIVYSGLSNSKKDVFFDFEKISLYDYDKISDYKKDLQKYSFEIWKNRNKKENKNGVYHIPRPTPFILIPEITLQKLNEDFQITELEMDLYLLMCKYKDVCAINKQSYKFITYE